MKIKLLLLIITILIFSFISYSSESNNLETVQISVKELERIVYDIFQTDEDNLCLKGYQVINGRKSRLPIGSTLDKEKGIFYWIPGPGFIGEYELLFESRKLRQVVKLNITISPKFGKLSSLKRNYRLSGTAAAVDPFGYFDTPLTNTTVTSSIPVTGWVLDDIEVENVKIYRTPNQGEPTQANGYVYIGDATFVEGARPDVEALYPDLPLNYRAGWGYMFLTNFTSDGTYVLYAIASDKEGHLVDLGSKTITINNANAVKPFGAIDTPAQGGTASGNSYVNWGWVLTPLPNTIPTDGSTITVYIDGISVGSPVYNLPRDDIATLLPGYNNTDGAVGYFYLDTTAYTNGLHTIMWGAVDDAGNEDGIGSRYFTVYNAGTDNQAPVVDAGQSQTITLPVNQVQLSATATDDGLPEGLTLSYTWIQESGPGTTTFDDSNALNTIATFDIAGNYVLQLTVSDSELSTPNTITITVNEEGSETDPSAEIPRSVSRTTGVAPLSVNFIAGFNYSTATERSFHNLDYSWDFGDLTIE